MNPVAVVTGAQQGIGAATAVALANDGYNVVVGYLDDEPAAESVAADIREAGRKAALARVDIADVRSVNTLVEAAHAGFGRIDALVNNAGVFPRSTFLEMTVDEWDRVQTVNLRGTAFASQAVARYMVAGSITGSIVMVTSRAMFGVERGAHYAASKAGLTGLTRSMALELAPHRIRVNAIAPGMTDTAQARGAGTDEDLAAQASRIPLGRMASAIEIAETIVFLASNRASFVTGEVLHVNGGTHMS